MSAVLPTSRRARVLGLCAALVVASVARPTLAAEHTHALAAGESLSSLAIQYYGASWKSVYIAARNGVTNERDVAVGTRLVIPACFTYRVRRGDSVADIAKRILGDRDRYKVLMQENGIKDAGDLAVGTDLLMPFHLRHVVEAGDTWAKLAQRYYRNARRAGVVEDYNPAVKALTPGERITVPIFDRATLEVASRRIVPPKPVAAATPPRAPTAAAAHPAPDKAPAPRTAPEKPAEKVVAEKPAPAPAPAPAADKAPAGRSADKPAPEPAGTLAGSASALSAAAAAAVAAVTGSSPAAEPPPASPDAAAPRTPGSTRAEMAKAMDDYRRAEYDAACPKLDSLLALGGMSLADRGTVVSYLGFCAVAYGNKGAAVEYFRKWLEIDPKAQLDPVTTSPKILAVFQEAVESAKAEEAEQR